MDLQRSAAKELIDHVSGGQTYSEKNRHGLLNDPCYRGWPSKTLRASAIETFANIEHSVLYVAPLSIARAYLSAEDARRDADVEVDYGAELSMDGRAQFGMQSYIAQDPNEQQPHRREIQLLEEAFWFDGPRTEEDIAAHRERVLALAENDEDHYAERNFALNLAPRSSLPAEARLVRDMRQTMDWLLVTVVRLVEEAIPGPFRIEEPDAQAQRDAYFRVMGAAAFAADYAMYDVFGTDCAVLRVSINTKEQESVPVDVTNLVRHQRDDLFAEAAAALPDPGVPDYDRFLLIDLWRKGGGREEVLGEHPFWLKR
ncbi:MAG: hypothetical protein AAGL49_11355 [Pseudomonadota bacterium]